MKIQHVEAVFLGYDVPFFFLSPSRQAAKKDSKKALRLRDLARDVFFQRNKKGINVFSQRQSIFISPPLGY
jgi:hypothetical protein